MFPHGLGQCVHFGEIDCKSGKEILDWILLDSGGGPRSRSSLPFATARGMADLGYLMEAVPTGSLSMTAMRLFILRKGVSRYRYDSAAMRIVNPRVSAIFSR